MTRDELIERAARAMCHVRHPCSSLVAEIFDMNIDGQANEFRDYARAVVALVLEEVMKVAEQFDAKCHGSLATDPVAAAEQAAMEIASALRTMKE